MDICDISNDVCLTREQEHILALEARVEELEAEVRLLRSKKKEAPKVIEVTPADMVSMETYKQLKKLYDDLWEETMPF